MRDGLCTGICDSCEKPLAVPPVRTADFLLDNRPGTERWALLGSNQ